MIWEYLELVRVYTKPKGRLPDFNDPVVLHRCGAGRGDALACLLGVHFTCLARSCIRRLAVTVAQMTL